MSSKIFGKGQYMALRRGDFVKLIASGTLPTLSVKTDFEQLPEYIFPPKFGFYFIEPQRDVQMIRPFTYEEDVIYPQDSNIITICDVDGEHAIQISQVNMVEDITTQPVTATS